MPGSGELRVLAVVWAAERLRLLGEPEPEPEPELEPELELEPEPELEPELELAVEGELAAVLGRAWRDDDEVELALHHDDVVSWVQHACSAVIPFRLGTCMRDEREVRAMLRAQGSRLARMLERVGGRIEMGLKLRLAGAPPYCVPAGLAAIHSLTSSVDDRDEELAVVEGGAVLSGRYLIERGAVEHFWAVFDELRGASPGTALMGSGPWAPYSFCNLQSN